MVYYFMRTRVKICLLNDLRKDVVQNIQDEQEKSKLRYDKKRKPHVKYAEGEYVSIKRTGPSDISQKMEKKFIGPYLVKEVFDNDRYVIPDIPKYHMKQKPYQSVLPPERLKPWKAYEEETTSEESDDDEFHDNHESLDDQQPGCIEAMQS
ncbi:hypothetical protein PPYR_11061 [Photinus pyralis]|uniref:Uncharacterized protein n=1 Tax=Photinus pyralis TaxID=7054 RepID=A0A5N4AI11_PHOPY|nr:hypothetical protein PPYR_11061 [Photinus pyralis]